MLFNPSENLENTAPSLTGSSIVSDGLPGTMLLSAPQGAPQQIAFVDRRVENVDDLAAVLPDASVYFIDSDQSGVRYISEVLAQYSSEDIESVHIFSHGQAGALQIGNEILDADGLTGYTDELAAWGESTTGDILLYGCDVASGEIGHSFIEQLAAIAGGDVQASTDLTGSAALGGDWDLESTVGRIESALAISDLGQSTYEGALSTRTITSNGGQSTATIFVQEGTRPITDVESSSNNRFFEKNGVFYSFDGGADTSLLRLNRYTGEIRFRKVPNFERPIDANGDNIYTANVLVTDRDGASDSQFMSIVVSDMAEGSNAPVITSGGGGGYFFKNIEEGTAFTLDMSTTDVDGDTEGKGITYRINAGEDADLFRVNKKGGLFFRERPDFENPEDSNGDNIYRLNILATDSTGLSDSQFIEFKVNDRAGDEPIDVSVASGERAVAALPDADPVGRAIASYTLTGPDSNRFEVVNNNLRFKSAPSFDSPTDVGANNEYNFTLTALNVKNIAIIQEVTVTVDPGQTELAIISDGGGNNAVVEVDENTTFVTDVNATSGNGDSEGNGFVYSLNAGNDRNLFNIDADTGVISFKNAPDFENPEDSDENNSYTVNVLLQDSDGQADSQFISIIVKDVTEAGVAPVITSSGGGGSAFEQVIEGSTLALDVNATDANGDTEGNGITYRINAGEDANRFTIDADTGEIFFKTQPDFENPGDDDGNNIYRINVLATDSTGLVDSQFIQIEVTNKVSLYLLGGQSNMVGVGSNIADLTGAQANPFPDVQIWQGGVNRFVDLKPGFNNNFGIGNGFGAEIGFGFALEAARQNGDVDTEEIYLVKYAQGATSLAQDWNPDINGNFYSDFRDWVGSALAKLDNAGIGYDIEGMLWMQGEQDALNVSQAANYEANLTNFIADIRTRYGQGVDFLIGQLHDELPGGFTEDEVVRDAQEDVADADDNNYLIETDDFTVSGDNVHFTSAGHLDLGEAFADVLINS